MVDELYRPPAVIKILALLGSILAIAIAVTAIFLQLKNYRKPLDQRLIVRLQLLVPLYALSSYMELVNAPGADFFDSAREIYEAFALYTFFTLMTTMLGGERSILVKTSGRPPVELIFPLNRIFNVKVDISDPYTFLWVKRGVLQYVWLKPVMLLAIVILRATGTYRQGVMALNSGYMWLGILYNISVTVSLYSLAFFWYTLHDDLAPFNPWAKFLCIKLILFFSYWQGFIIGIFMLLGLIPAEKQDAARALQNFLMCLEMVGFAIGHWKAFSYKEFASSSMMGYARLPFPFAIRDAFGIVDLIQDFNSTFWGEEYGYRQFDSVEAVIAHPESASRHARLRDGLRYSDGGASKYWLPDRQTPKKPNVSTSSDGSTEFNNRSGSSSPDESSLLPTPDINDAQFAADERLYALAKQLPYGDYNYPVITVKESYEYLPIMERARNSASTTGSYGSLAEISETSEESY